MACVSARKFFGIIIPFFAIFLMSQNVSAFSFGSSASYPIKSCVSAIGDPVQKYLTGVVNNGGCSMIQTGQTSGVAGWVKSASVVFNNSIPAPALVTLEFTVNGSNTIGSFEAQNAVLLNYDVERYTDNISTFHVIATYYISSNTNNFAWATDMFYVQANARIDVSRASVVLLFNGITADQLTALQNALATKLQSIDANIVIGDQRLLAIYNLLDDQGDTIDEINDNIDERNQKEYESVDNIENQSPSDVSDAESQQTTSLIGVLQSFLSELNSFSATNCNVVLPFPSFMGGNMTVNICQHKDKAGSFISIIGSLIMMGFYIPFVYTVLKMIYNEIRSFTNG